MFSGREAAFGSLILDREKFPEMTAGVKTNGEALRCLSKHIEALGWKGLGGWVCAQEAQSLQNGKTVEAYWTEKCREAKEGGFRYWKVDWGRKGQDAAFRKMLTEIGKREAVTLTIEHAITPSVLPYADVFRTYDVPAIMSIPMTMQKIAEIASEDNDFGLLCCEDEVYMAAAGGFTMGVMRHPFIGPLPDGRADMSFPAVHRNLKSKLYEVLRAVRWHRTAPAFGGAKGSIRVSENKLCETWRFDNIEEEIEEWWQDMPSVKTCMEGNVLKKYAPACIVRHCTFPRVEPDANGEVPFAVASRHPNGVFSVATLGRTTGRIYGIPKCNVMVKTEGADVIGVFGTYKNLFLETERKTEKILLQDMADTVAYDVTEYAEIREGIIRIPGEWIQKIGTMAQPENDTSEPGAVIKLITEGE